MKKSLALFITLVFLGLHFGTSLSSQQPATQKDYWQRFKAWLNSEYEAAPQVAKIGVAMSVLSADNPRGPNPLNIIPASYVAYQGVNQAWQGIIDGKITSALASGPLLMMGLGMGIFPHLSETGSIDKWDVLAAITALGFGVTGAGLISAVYHNLIAPIIAGNIPNTPVVDQALKNVTRRMVKAAIDDDLAFPTDSIKINTLLKGDELLNQDDTDAPILDACNDLIKEYAKNKQTGEQESIDHAIDKLKKHMSEQKITELKDQITFLMEKKQETKYPLNLEQLYRY
jgi:hypothetical protein